MKLFVWMILIAWCAYLGGGSARADLLVLKSNVEIYPAGARVKGDKIEGLMPGDRIQVLDLSDRKTRMFEGDAIEPGRAFGTRRVHKETK